MRATHLTTSGKQKCPDMTANVVFAKRTRWRTRKQKLEKGKAKEITWSRSHAGLDQLGQKFGVLGSTPSIFKFSKLQLDQLNPEFSRKDKIWCRKPISPLSRFDQSIIFHPTSPLLLRFEFIVDKRFRI